MAGSPARGSEGLLWGTPLRRKARRSGALIRRAWSVFTRWMTPRRRRAISLSVAKPVLAVLLGISLAMALVEVVLRIPGPHIPRSLDTVLFSCYDTVDLGKRVMFGSPELGVSFLKPNFTASCGFNGHHWTHKTDAYGFRNPQTWDQADVVLLGDSMIYGHGVEENQTAGHFLRGELGTRVANLAFMGDSPTDYMVVARNFAVHLHPKLVFVFLFANDLDDLVVTHTMQSMRDFVDEDHAPELGLYSRAELLAPAFDAPRPLAARLEQQWLAFRTVKFLLKARQTRGVVWKPPPVATHTYPAPLPTGVPPLEEPEAEAVLYTRKAMRYVKLALDEVGAQLVIVALPGLFNRDEDWQVDYAARLCARDLGVPVFSAREVMATPDGRVLPHTRLAFDGHLAELGHKRLAELLARKTRENHWLD